MIMRTRKRKRILHRFIESILCSTAGAIMSRMARTMIYRKMSPTKIVQGQAPKVENDTALNPSGKLSHCSKFQDFGMLSQVAIYKTQLAYSLKVPRSNIPLA